MTRPTILITAPMPPAMLEALDAHFTAHRLWEQPDADAFLAAHGPTIRGLAGNALQGRVDAATLDRLPALEIIANYGVGYDRIDVPAAVERGIVVTNTPGVLDAEVADLAVALLLATLRRIPEADRFVRDGRWAQGGFPVQTTLQGRTVGILGLGAIGKAIAHRLEAFGVAIAYHGRHRQDGVPYVYHDTPLALATACDTLIAIVPGGQQTQHLVDAEVLAALGSSGVFVNVARGSVVDQDALIAALSDGTILAAGLDVFAQEPDVPQRLRDLPNTVLLPHVGSATGATRDAMGRLVVDNLVGWFEQGKPVTPVPETAHLVKR